MKKYINIAKDMFRLYSNRDMDVYAGYSTLFIVTAAFPFLMLLIAILNMIPGYSPEDFVEFLFRFLPDVESIRSLVTSMITNLKNQSGGLLASVTALTTLWSASKGISAIQKGLKQITPGAPKDKKDILVSLLFTFLFIIMIPLILVFQLMGSSLTGLLNDLISNYPVLASIGKLLKNIIQVSGILTPIAAAAVILLTYTFLPGGKRTIRSQLPGAIFAAICWQVFSLIFAAVMPSLWKSSIYGSLASLFLVLMWLRIIIMILFYGASLNTTLQKQTGEVTEKSA